MKRNTLLTSTALLVGLSMVSCSAEAANIWSGTKGGAYEGTFCPPVPAALESEYFFDYVCTESKGTLDNIEKVLANPTDIGFAQFDVLAREGQKRPEVAENLVAIRTLACEGLWMVTKNPRINSFGDVLGLAGRIPFALGPTASGGFDTFNYLKSIDPDGLGKARNIKNYKSTRDVIAAVASGSKGEVGFFVQFADPTNPNVQLVMEQELKVIPVISREVVDAMIGEDNLFDFQEFKLEADGFFATGEAMKAACTPVVIFTGNPEMIADSVDRDNQLALIEAVQNIPEDALLPAEPFLAKLLKTASRISDDVLDEMVAATDAAKKLIDEQL